MAQEAPDLVFDGLASTYATFRPSPPLALVAAVVDYWKKGSTRPIEEPTTEEGGGGESPQQAGCTRLVDVGCGSGQSTHLFAPHFDDVVGVDASIEQLKVAREQHAGLTNVRFMEGTAEQLPLEAGSVDVVSVCAAVHWFRLPTFYVQVDRVLRPGGVLAVYSYHSAYPLHGNTCLRPVMDEIVQSLDQWPPNYRQLLTSYADLPAPYSHELYFSGSDGQFEVSWQSDLAALLGYVSSWSALAKYGHQHGDDAAQAFLAKAKTKLLAAMNTTEDNPKLLMRHKYFLRMWRKPVM